MLTRRCRSSLRRHGSIAAALMLAVPSGANADQSLSLNNLVVPNAQAPVNASPEQLVPLPTGTYYTGTLTGIQVTATACLWTGVNPTTCDQLVWPKAGDLAIIVWEPAAQPWESPTVLLQVGGATRYGLGSPANFPWIQGQSSGSPNHPGACDNALGCAGGTPGNLSPCTTGTNGGGQAFFASQQFTAGQNGWPSAIPVGPTTKVMAAWLPAPNTNTQNPPSNAWTDPNNDGSGAKFCSIDIQFTGVTAGTAPPCANPTYRDSVNCGDPCTCSTTNAPASCGLPVGGVHAVEIRFENRSGRPAHEVALLPYSCSASFATANNPGVLYKDAACTQLLWRDGLFSAFGPRNLPFNGCGHGPGWADSPCATVFAGAGPTVPMRTMRLSDLHDNGDGTYSLWTNHFPNAIWYIGLPQKNGSGWTTVPEVPFWVPWPSTTQYGSTDTIEVAGLQCLWRAWDQVSQTNYFAPAAPAAGDGGAPWPVKTAGDCEQTTTNGCPSVSNGVDWQQLEITMDGNPADIADITYIDFMNVPLRLESFNAPGGPVLESTGFRRVTDAEATVHPEFKELAGKFRRELPANLYLTCDGSAPGTVLQSAGPNQTDATCADSKFIPTSYPAHATGVACDGSGGVINNFRAVFEKAIAHQAQGPTTLPLGSFPGHPGVPGCAWIRDWLGAPNGNPNKFDYDFVMQVSRDDTVPGQTSYTAMLKGTVTVHNSGSSQTSDPLTIVLGTDTYFFGAANTLPILDLTRAIYLAPTPGNMPLTLQVPNGCSYQSLATISLMGPGDVASGDPRLSLAWVNLMGLIDPSISTPGNPSQWFGAGANTNVTALIGRLMGDAYAGFALGFVASEGTNPIIPPGGLKQWPGYGTTYPATTGQCADCYYDDATPGTPFWQTPSGAWWGGALFPANAVGGATYWSADCAKRIFSKHYADIAPPVNGSPMCSDWGSLIHQHTAGGYSHPIEDRMNGYKAGINGYRYGSTDVNMLKVTVWSGISATTAATLAWDLNGDGRTNGVDLGILLSQWGNCASVPGGCQSDFDQDGDVDGEDLGQMLGNWSVP